MLFISIVVTQIYIPANIVLGFSLLHILANICYSQTF